MVAAEPFRGDRGAASAVPSGPGGLMDMLGVAAVVLDAEGRIVLWSPQAKDLFGYSPEEALGRFAGPLLVHEDHLDQVLELFADVMAGGGSWAGVFPVRHKDGSARMVEFRNMRLLDEHQGFYALGLATDQEILRRVERDLALSTRLVSQSPIGLAVLDTDLRYVTVNAAEERLSGVRADEHVGRTVHEVLPALSAAAFESTMRRVLESGVPVLDRYTVGRTPADPDNEHAWSISFFRLEDSNGKVLGVATASVDVTERHRMVQEQRRTALMLQRSLLPHPPPQRPGLDIAYRYRPARATSEIGGDWFDVIPLGGDKSALVVGDVMGSGINAAATMGQLRTATRTLADLDLLPAQVMHHLDRVTSGLGEAIATCVYAVYDPHHARCRISLAGHLPPVLLRHGGRAELLELPTGAPLGVGEVPFTTTTLSLRPGDQLVLYTDGLVEIRDTAIDKRLDLLVSLLDHPGRPLEDTCDWLLDALRQSGDHDDVALLVVRATGDGIAGIDAASMSDPEGNRA
ncbi:SpoIIE family protein phosphatase [Streptomyces sp. NPDC096176]|uniref:SpoIIE family protein phosphatase n=1 Tax=Streptomyces sp. NPDC096176 TaxID=3366079 RepID=UPI00381D2F15